VEADVQARGGGWKLENEIEYRVVATKTPADNICAADLPVATAGNEHNYGDEQVLASR